MADDFSSPGVYVTPPQGVEPYTDPLQRAARDTLLSPTATTGLGGLAPSPVDTAVAGQPTYPFTTEATLQRPAAGLAPPAQAPRSGYEAVPIPTFRAPQAAPVETGPQVAYNSATKQFYVGGNIINAANALEVEEGAKLLGQPGRPLPREASGWQPIDPSSYMTFLETLKKPRTVSEDIALGAKSLAAGAVSGAGRLAQIAGATEAGPAIAKFAEERIGPTKEEQARTALINQSNSFWQNVLDASAQGSSSVAASLIGGVGGFLVGGPIGAGVGAGLVSLLPNISAMWDAAKQNKYDENDPGVQAQIIGGALAVSALDAIPIGRGAKHIFSPAVKEAAEKAGQSVFRRALTGARRGSAEEAVTEAMQEIVQSVWFDPQVRSKLSQGDIAALAPYVAQNYGREALVAGGAGAILGGIFGGGVGAIAGRRGVDTGEPTNVLAGAGAKAEGAPAPTMESLLSPFDALPPADPSGGIRYAPPLPGAQPGFTQLYPELTPQGAAAPASAVAIPGITEDFPIGPSRGLPPPTQPLLLPPPPALPTAVSAPAIPMGGPPPVSGPVIYVPPSQEERATRGVDPREAPLATQTAPPATVQTPTEVVTAATEGGVTPQAAPVAPVAEAGPTPVPTAAAAPVVETPAATPAEPTLTLDQRKAAILEAYDALDTAAQKKAFRKAVAGKDYNALIFREAVNNATEENIAAIEARANEFAASLTTQAQQQEAPPAQAQPTTQAAPVTTAPKTEAAPAPKAPTGRKRTIKATAVKPEVKEARAPRAPAPTVAPAAQPAPAAAEPTTRPQMTSAGTLVRGIGKIDAKLVAYTKDLVEMTALRARDVVVLSMDDIGLVRDTVLPQTNDDAYVATAVVNGRPTHFVVINDARKFTARKTLELTAHEVGHIVQDDGFATAPTKVRDAISTDYNRHVARYGNKTVREFVKATFPTERAITYIADGDPAILNQTLNQISTTNRELYDYLAGSQGFSEWFANQVSRWATTTKKPLTIVEKFFADLGRMLRRVYEGLTSKAADDGLPVESMREFLDNLTPPVISQTVPPAPPKGAPRVQAAQAAEARAAVEPTPNTPDRIIDYTNKNLGFLPGPIREASQNVAINLLEAAKRGVYGMSFGNDLVSQVSKHLPSARQFFDVLTSGASVVREAGEARDLIFRDLTALKLPQQQEVFKVGLSQTSRGKWGYEPEWLKGRLDAKGNPVEIKIDPVAKAEWDKFKAANPKGAAVLDRMFEHMYNLDQRLRTTVRSLVEADLTTEEYNALPTEDKVKRRADVATRLKMFDVYGRIQGPYLPMSRFGEYIVVARSKQLQALEAIPIADRSKEEAEQLAEMRKDADHYDVRFFPSKATAVKARREIQAAYPDHDVVDFNKISDIKNLKDEASRTLLTLRAALKENVGTTEEAKKAEAALDDAIMSLYVRGLAESSARRRKLPREGVAGVNPEDMPQSFDLGSQSLAMFIGNMTKSSELAPILEQLREEASVMGDSQKALNDNRPADMQVTSSRDDRTRAMRELMLRHVDGVAQQPTGRLVEMLTTGTVTYLLTTLPRYHLMNATQFAMMTQPKLAARFGQSAAWEATFRAYRGMLQSIKTDEGGFYSGKFDITKLKSFDPVTKTFKNITGGELAAIEAARDRSLLDVGLGLELAHFRSYSLNKASSLLNKTMQGLTNLSRRVEYTNRVVTTLTSYNLKLAQLKKNNPDIDPKSAEKQAIDFAIETLRTTQGDPTMENAPRYFSKVPGGKVILQFRKFQLLQVSEIIRHVHTMFKDADPQERQIARAALGYLMLNTAVMSGAVGIPGVTLAAYVLGAAFGDDEDLKYSVGSYTSRGERALREALGDNAIANILIKGIPTGFGIDVGAQLGMGNTFSLLPYTDMDLSSKEGYNKMVVGMLGPLGSIGSNFADGFGMIHRGDYWKGTELMLPTGFRAAMRAYRETYADGVTTRAGDQLVSPEEFNFLKTVVNGLGIPTTDMQKIRDTRRDIYDFDVYFKDRTSTLRRQFVEARKDRDMAAQEDIKGQWRELQTAKQRVGFKPTPLSSLLLAPTEQARREKRGQEQFRRVQEAQ